MATAVAAIAWISRLWAIAGGLVLLAVMLMTVTSVAMRYTFGSPILGDFELVEMGTAIAAFAFLPHCQLTRGNVAVDVFTTKAPPRVQAALTATGSLALALIALLLLWRMTLGGHDFFRYGEVTTNIGVPRWWAFPPILLSLALLVLTSLVTLAEDLGVLGTGGEPS
ncbi:MAG TPA: TRAP transporter small permease [Geminicoccaceae bacterium]